MKKIIMMIAAALLVAACTEKAGKPDKEMDRFISNLMSKMTIEEKIGQLNLSGGDIPGVLSGANGIDDIIKEGLLTATGWTEVDELRRLQTLAVDSSRLGIPLLCGVDVIHGFQTVFPIPLASSCSWDLDLIEKSARIAAIEASSNGVSWTYSPMVDIARDARWGRIAEGAGEDPWWGAQIAAAMVRGYQGEDLSDEATILACVKHFALYGAAEAGRDYNTVDMSRLEMYNDYLAPYKAAVQAGAGSAMSSFGLIEGIPASGNKWLLTDLLRDEWGFEGVVMTDWFTSQDASFMGCFSEIYPISSSVGCIKAGNDWQMPGCLENITDIEKAVESGELDLSDLVFCGTNIIRMAVKCYS
jgi:beta-glucosidase